MISLQLHVFKNEESKVQDDLHNVDDEPSRGGQQHDLCIYVVLLRHDSLYRQINQNTRKYPDKQDGHHGSHHL